MTSYFQDADHDVFPPLAAAYPEASAGCPLARRARVYSSSFTVHSYLLSQTFTTKTSTKSARKARFLKSRQQLNNYLDAKLRVLWTPVAVWYRGSFKEHRRFAQNMGNNSGVTNHGFRCGQKRSSAPSPPGPRRRHDDRKRQFLFIPQTVSNSLL